MRKRILPLGRVVNVGREIKGLGSTFGLGLGLVRDRYGRSYGRDFGNWFAAGNAAPTGGGVLNRLGLRGFQALFGDFADFLFGVVEQCVEFIHWCAGGGGVSDQPIIVFK